MTSAPMGLARLWRSPREIPALVIGLGVGMGFATAAYTILHAALLSPLPYETPARLVRLWQAHGPAGFKVLSLRDAEALGAGAEGLTGVASYAPLQQQLRSGAGNDERQILGQRVSPNLFRVLGCGAMRGQVFSDAENRSTDAVPIVLSARLAAREALDVGAVISLDGRHHRVVGIMDAQFWFPDRATEYWVPLSIDLTLRSSATASDQLLPALGRLAPEWNSISAAAEADGILSVGTRSATVAMQAYRASLVGDLTTPLAVLQAGSCLIVLLTCMNAAWLFRWRVRRFQSDIAIAAALGASPGRLVCEHLFGVCGVGLIVAPIAVLVAWVLLRLAALTDNGYLSAVADPTLSMTVIGAAAAAAVVVTITASFPATAVMARIARRRTTAFATRTAASALRLEYAAMVAQGAIVFAIALNAVMLLLVLTGMFERNVGFTNTDILSVSLATARNSDLHMRADAYLDTVRMLQAQGITASVTNVLPLTRRETMTSVRRSDGDPRHQVMARLRVVSDSYFAMCGMTLVEGRFLSSRDAGAGYIVVNVPLARQVLRTLTPLGTHVVLADHAFAVVGVTEPILQSGLLEEPRPEAYLLYNDVRLLNPAVAGYATSGANLLVNASHARGLEAILKTTVEATSPGASVSSIVHFRDLVWIAARERPLLTVGAGALAFVALMLLAGGFHAMLAHSLGERHREIAIRMALGASQRRIAFELVAPVAIITLMSAFCGVVGAIIVRSFVGSLPYVPSTTTPPVALVLLVTLLIIVCATALACYRPVRAASRVDPGLGLRAE